MLKFHYVMCPTAFKYKTISPNRFMHLKLIKETI